MHSVDHMAVESSTDYDLVKGGNLKDSLQLDVQRRCGVHTAVWITRTRCARHTWKKHEFPPREFAYNLLFIYFYFFIGYYTKFQAAISVILNVIIRIVSNFLTGMELYHINTASMNNAIKCKVFNTLLAITGFLGLVDILPYRHRHKYF